VGLVVSQEAEAQTIARADTLDATWTQAFFRQMMTIRLVEERLLRLFSEGALNGTVHTCLGQEACCVGVVNALDRDKDILFSNHRGHGHFLAYCDDVEGLIAELMGRQTGVCAGVGGSQHLHKRNFYSNGILGGIVPVATGMALAEKRKRTGAISVVFIGDGALGEGVIYESFNIASLWQLPILFVVEHNGYAQSTPTHLEHAGNLAARATPYGIPVTVIEATEVEEVYAAARECADAVRRESRPRMLFQHTHRFAPHSKGDDTRDPEEIARIRSADPLLRLQARLNAETRERILAEVETRIESAVEAARRAPIADFFALEASWPR